MDTIRKLEHHAATRLESIRVLVHEMLQTMDSLTERQEAGIYLYGVSAFASMLAMKRGQNTELAAIAGLLHRYYGYKTGITDFAGANSAEAVRPLLRDSQLFSEEERIIILRAIFYHDDRNQVHGPEEEIIKDAIVLQSFFQTAGKNISGPDAPRLQKLLPELDIPGEFEVCQNEKSGMLDHLGNKRRKLADIAEELAGSNIIGLPGDEQYREICKYWPDTGIYQAIRGSWCAAFVYHCSRQAGIKLPIRYPNGFCRFAGVGAWLEWLNSLKINFSAMTGRRTSHQSAAISLSMRSFYLTTLTIISELF